MVKLAGRLGRISQPIHLSLTAAHIPLPFSHFFIPLAECCIIMKIIDDIIQ